MLVVETVAKIRRAFLRLHESNQGDLPPLEGEAEALQELSNSSWPTDRKGRTQPHDIDAGGLRPPS